MLAAALPTWAFVLAYSGTGKAPEANSLLSHNVAMRRDIMLRHPYQTFRRSYCSSLLYFDLKRAGARIVYQPAQRVAHGMTFRWWVRIHFRRGWECYTGRELDPSWPRIRFVAKMKFVEPVALRMGLVLRDARHWFRYARVVGVGGVRAILLWPLVIAAVFTARTAEMAGMYAGLTKPQLTKDLARF